MFGLDSIQYSSDVESKLYGNIYGRSSIKKYRYERKYTIDRIYGYKFISELYKKL